MSAYIQMDLECDGHDSCPERVECAERVKARLLVHATDKGKLRGKLDLPPGWIEVPEDAYRDRRILCPKHGREEQPWNY